MANKKVEDQVKTYITYNKGRDWRLLQAPDVDLHGSPVHCLLVSHPVSHEVHRASWSPGDVPSGAFFHQEVLGTYLVLGRDFPQVPGWAMIYGLRLSYHLDGKFS